MSSAEFRTASSQRQRRYSTSMRLFAGSQRYAGAPNSWPRSIICRRRLRHRRNAELHTARQRLAVPRRVRAAMVLLPDAHPGKIRLLPHIAERQPRRRRKGHENASSRAGSIRCVGEGAGGGVAVHQPQVGGAALAIAERGASRTRRPREGSRGCRIRLRTPWSAWPTRGTAVTPFSRKGGPRVTCWVHPMGRSQATRLSTDSRMFTLRPRNSSRRSKSICARGKRARIVRTPSCSAISYVPTEPSPCASMPAAASSAEGPPKISRQRLWPMIPESRRPSAPVAVALAVNLVQSELAKARWYATAATTVD